MPNNGDFMSQIKDRKLSEIDDAEEYDFSKMKPMERGQYARDLQQGYTITVHKSDGSTEVRQIPASANVVILDADVQAYFPDSKAVNNALRGLLALVPRRAA